MTEVIFHPGLSKILILDTNYLILKQ